MYRMTRYLVCVAFIFSGTACRQVSEPGIEPVDYSDIETISYNEHVQPLLNRSCISCHAGPSAAAGLKLDSWENLIPGSSSGESIIPFDAEKSHLINMVTKLRGGNHPAEQNADTLSTVETDFLARWIDEGARNEQGEVPWAESTDLLYVCNQNENMVSIIDTKTNVVIRNIYLSQLGFSDDAAPHFSAVDPTGTFWYLTLVRDGKVVKLDRQNQVVAQTSLPMPAMLALHPVDDALYVSRFMDPQSPPTSVFSFRQSDLTGVPDLQGGEIPVLFRMPHAMAITSTGSHIFTASIPQNRLVVIEHAKKEAVAFLPLGENKGPLQAVLSPDDKQVFLSCQASNQVFVIEMNYDDLSQSTTTDTISVGSQPWHPGFSLDGNYVYVGNNGSNSVSMINAQTRKVEKTITGNGLAQPHGLAVSRNGFIYVSNRNLDGSYVPRHDFGDNSTSGTVVVIDAATHEIVKILEVGKFAAGLSIWESN